MCLNTTKYCHYIMRRAICCRFSVFEFKLKCMDMAIWIIHFAIVKCHIVGRSQISFCPHWVAQLKHSPPWGKLEGTLFQISFFLFVRVSDNTNKVIRRVLFLENNVFGLNIDGDNATRPGPRSIISINIETSYIIF